ncbi:glycosyl transferase group 1 [Gluconacetobacter diazotrophicus PA1 5]|uniref:glycosyltransferase family 4 protein n=1 Tax=Gluconacetobacter diazotrophicus TaxID=33996 RepID=UPI000173B0D2|nr:glycosyltransferase family 1 protein [Gluconacetobacter diazotrophicus]ACI50435.1 glycosyl transferase group 1 [Gluconacetobacter diazotrophicus PA1 5]TWB08270.1 glycosyl transferase family 1 [Gluconacetobacter diazotrophicus]
MMSNPILMDISRLLSRAGSAVPTGIDRVELEYALYLSRNFPARVTFVAYHPLGRIGVLPRRPTTWFLRMLARAWTNGTRPWRGASLMAGLLLQAAAAGTVGETARRRLYLLLSHHHLMKRDVIAGFMDRANAGLAVMVHDLIPIDYPEYARPTEPDRHRQRMDTVGQLADSVIVPSQAVADSLRHYLAPGGRCPPIGVVHHGCHVDPISTIPVSGLAPDVPYFVVLGTIEPRKNHLLLLNIWRHMATGRDRSRLPHLVVIGRRGWENENILDMMERCPALQGVVHEYATLSDVVVADLVRGARALLFPSFAEGFGLPLLEALSMGTPCLCSDLPVFREIAGDLPCYLDPLDGPGWQRRILDLAGEDTRENGETPVFADWPAQVAAGLATIDGAVRADAAAAVRPMNVEARTAC